MQVIQRGRGNGKTLELIERAEELRSKDKVHGKKDIRIVVDDADVVLQDYLGAEIHAITVLKDKEP